MNKTVLVTGATGYLGSHLVKRLVHENFQVYVFVRDKDNLKKMSGLQNRIGILDFRDNLDIKFDFIVHAATCYGRNNETHSEIFNNNVLLPIKILEKNTHLQNSIFVNVDTILNKYINLYAFTKKQFLEYLIFNQKKFKSVVNVQFDFMYGPNEESCKFTQYLLESFKKQYEVQLTKGEQIRNFIYIDDLVEGFYKIITHLNEVLKMEQFYEFQIGSDSNMKLKEYILLLHKLSASNSKLLFGAVPYRENELMKTTINNDAIKKIGWKAKFDIEESLFNCIKEGR
ncbi:NAD-dependent epimerase/dehydratase family protein [Lysinibacillus pakistanensis]|uniref:NAD-dependent epimerase/dehydratase family protein n=1 Tax=Lysinibacillus pakistanensis TaxID=759811 RepID=UPI003D2DD56D